MKDTRFKILMTLMLMLITTSCQTERLSPIQLQIVGYSLKRSDLPNGWSLQGKDWSADFGGESYVVIYQLDIDMHIFITHTISMHSSEDRARNAYKEWESNWFDVTNLKPDISYSPKDKNDDYRYECFQMKPDDPLMDCIYLQRHNQIINFVKINFDARNEKNPTFMEIKNILNVLDKQINEVVDNASSKTNP